MFKAFYSDFEMNNLAGKNPCGIAEGTLKKYPTFTNKLGLNECHLQMHLIA
jgi:hypothetical protein